MQRVLVCGGRDFADEERLRTTLDLLAAVGNITTIIHGRNPRGADQMANQWAEDNGIAVDAYPADWNTYGRAAGPIRNKQMIEEGRPDRVIAFPGGKGTANMIKQARAHDLFVFEVPESGK